MPRQTDRQTYLLKKEEIFMYLFVFMYLFIYSEHYCHGNCLGDSAKVLEEKGLYKKERGRTQKETESRGLYWCRGDI